MLGKQAKTLSKRQGFPASIVIYTTRIRLNGLEGEKVGVFAFSSEASVSMFLKSLMPLALILARMEIASHA